jgi:hypothetical protein
VSDIILRGDRNVVKLDIDSTELPSLEPMMLKLRRAGYQVRWLSQRRSPSGSGWHLCLKLKPCPRTAIEVVAVQAILGSDAYREACNLHRAKMIAKVSPYWRDRWNVLYSRSLKQRRKRGRDKGLSRINGGVRRHGP